LALGCALISGFCRAEAGQRLYDFEAVVRQDMARIGARPGARLDPKPVTRDVPPQAVPLLAGPMPAAPTQTAQAPVRPEPPQPEGRGFVGRTVSEFVLGVWAHDPGQDNNESDTWDVNAEIKFRPVRFAAFENRFLRFFFEPRPVVGGSINTEGHTHTAYVALDWTHPFENGIFLGGSFGLTYHTGILHQATEECPSGTTCSLAGNRRYVDTGDVSLGTRVLFRESLEIGYRFDGRHGIAFHAAHMSQASFFDGDNDGMNFVGLRYSYALP
jgi:hypothetical protein